MTKKNRTILFLIFLFLFVLVTPSTIFYSQGYRFDFDTKKITQTGGLFLKVLPKKVEVFINGKLKKKTDFFFGSILIENLLPKKYKVEVKKEGYHSWEKNLEIKEKQVTEAKNIILFRETPNFNILVKEIKAFWFSPDEKKIILKEDTHPLPGKEGWTLKLYDLEKNVKSHLIKEKDIYSKDTDLMDLKWSTNSKEIYLNIGLKEQEKNFVLKLDKFPPALTEKKITTSSENILTSFNFNGDFYYLDNSGHLFKNKEKITEKPFPIKKEAEYTLEIFPDYIFLMDNQILYLLNPNSKSFEKFFEPIKEIKISPDFKKLVFFSDYEVWILFLKDILDQPQKKANEKLFLARFSKKIENLFWLNSNYLIFNSGDKIKIAEIDDRDKINIVDFTEFKDPKIFFNKSDKKLYILSEGNLYVSESLF